jgi:tryptophanyl-tRNA synthetase
MTDPLNSSSRPRVLSGMRPTGKLHLGNYMGALANWVKLQDDYECYFFIADWHALTTDYADPSQIRRNISDVALDYLAAGLDPERSVLFVQSHVPQHAELHLLLSMITSVSWLERVPTYKEQQENLAGKDLTTYGFLGYPLLQAADILLYQPKFVPVGQDQVVHVELTREIARRFNFFYPRQPMRSQVQYSPQDQLVAEFGEEASSKIGPEGKGGHYRPVNISEIENGGLIDVLPEPLVLLTPSPKLPGTDGRKMSKSYGNTIGLTDSAIQVSEKLQKMTNGGQRNFISDRGDPEACPVYDLHKLFSPREIIETTGIGCRSATISCTECKQLVAERIIKCLQPIQNRRSEFEFSPKRVVEILENGAQRAADRAEKTMVQVRDVMGVAKQIPFGGVTVFDRMSHDTGTPINHVLANHRSVWNESSDKVDQFLIDYWKSEMVPSEFTLRLSDERQFVTNRNKRVLVSTSREEPGGWHFRIPAKSFEVWALLCWERSLLLNDFIIPQKYFSEIVAIARKTAKEREIHLHVKKLNGRWYLTLVTGSREIVGGAIRVQADEPVDITHLRSKYEPLA